MQCVEELFASLSTLESSVIAVHPGRCVLVRNHNADCLKCAQVCTSGAISVGEDAVVVDELKCIGCGTCATACPSCALELRDPADRNLFDEARAFMERTEGDLVIACEKADAAACAVSVPAGVEGPVRVKCLGRVDESLLVGALAVPWAREAVLVSGACAECTHCAGREVVRDVVASTNTLLEAWGEKMRVRLEEATLDAREIVPLVQSGEKQKEGGDLPEFQLQKVGADGTLPHHVPMRRRRLAAALSVLGPAPDVAVNTRLWGCVSIDVQRCNSCRMCATFCPAGAISKWDGAGEGEFGLVHQPQLCVKCRSCENICPVDALQVHDAVPAHALVDGGGEYIPLAVPAFRRGDGHDTKRIFGSLLGLEEVYDR